MDKPVELDDITGQTVHVDDEHAYETAHVSTDNKYENLKINTLAEEMTASMGSDDPTRNVNRVEVSKPEVDAAAFRKLQIAFVIVCSVLLTMLIISSLTIGVLIHKLNSRVAVIELNSQSSTAAIEANKRRQDLIVNGAWSLWSTWSSCTKTCNTGQKHRSRTCTKPAPVGMGRSCVGNSDELSNCNESPCPVDGHWTDWSLLSGCSVTCGSGQQMRQRTCSNPSPAYGGLTCRGASLEQVACQSFVCPVNGVWSTWSTWSICTMTCNTGQKHRSRTCNNPAPVGMGRSCVGNSNELTNCNENPCPVNGHWTDWSLLSGCSVTCGSGQQARQRTCSNPSPANGGLTCQGASSEQVACQSFVCPVNGGWSSWSTWSSCTKTCNTGQKHRSRTCTNPAPVGMEVSCVGNSDELSNCNESPCLDPTSAFAVYGATPTNKSPTVVFPPSAVKLNIGGHYNTTTGKYTCHYQGIYVFSLNLYKKSTANYVYCYIRKNGSVHAVARVASDSEYGFYESSASTVLRLTRGDTVDVGSCSNPGNIDGRTSFIGFLLKAD